MNNLQVVEQREVLGKEFKIYGDFENPLFLAKDVAEWIEHSKSDVMLKSVDDNEKVKVNNVYVDGRTGGNGVWFLTEDGLYEVLMQSRKPIAKEFKKEVKKILKTIRQNGMYVTEKLLDNPDLAIQAFTKLLKIFSFNKVGTFSIETISGLQSKMRRKNSFSKSQSLCLIFIVLSF